MQFAAVNFWRERFYLFYNVVPYSALPGQWLAHVGPHSAIQQIFTKHQRTRFPKFGVVSLLITSEFFLCSVICTFGLSIGPCLLRLFTIISLFSQYSTYSRFLENICWRGGGEKKVEERRFNIKLHRGQANILKSIFEAKEFSLRPLSQHLSRKSCLCNGSYCRFRFLSYVGCICHHCPSVSPPNKARPSLPPILPSFHPHIFLKLMFCARHAGHTDRQPQGAQSSGEMNTRREDYQQLNEGSRS